MKQKIKKLEELKITLRKNPGQPKLIEKQPLLLKAITEIAIHGSSDDDRRRTDIIKTCRTLSELNKELKNMGFNLSRSENIIICYLIVSIQ